MLTGKKSFQFPAALQERSGSGPEPQVSDPAGTHQHHQGPLGSRNTAAALEPPPRRQGSD